jgi:hypothetical protein
MSAGVVASPFVHDRRDRDRPRVVAAMVIGSPNRKVNRIPRD